MKIRFIHAVSFCSTRIIGWTMSNNADETVRRLNLAARQFGHENNMNGWSSALFFTKSEEYEAPEPDGGLLFVTQDSVTDKITGITGEYDDGQRLSQGYTDTLTSYTEVKGDMYEWINRHRGYLF